MMNGRRITMEELFYFVREQYPAIIKKETNTNESVAIHGTKEEGKFPTMKEIKKEFDKILSYMGHPEQEKHIILLPMQWQSVMENQWKNSQTMMQ